jgi:hypothetical protein
MKDGIIPHLLLFAFLATASGCTGDTATNPAGPQYDTVTVQFQDGVHPDRYYFDTRDAILKDGPNSNIRNGNSGSVPIDTLGYVPLSSWYYERRLILRMDISLINSCTTVIDDSLFIGIVAGGPDTLHLEAYEVDLHWSFRDSWLEGIGGVGNGVSWLTIDGRSSWPAPGGDYFEPLLAETVVVADSVAAFSLPPALVYKWISNPYLNNGIIIKIREAAGVHYRRVHMRESSDPIGRPRLWIRYLQTKGGG